MKQYQIYELTFKGKEPEGDFVNVDIKGTFQVNGKKTFVKGFYDGEENYRVRYLPLESGWCEYKVESSLELCGTMEGREWVEVADHKDHGLVRVNNLSFQYEDGTPYLPYGTTVYALLHQEKILMDETMETLKTAPFNKVRLCIFPKHFEFNHNEPEIFPFERDAEGNWDVKRPGVTFWKNLDDKLNQLQEYGIQADLILLHPYDCWGLMYLTREEYEIYLEYLIRRVAAYPNVWWSLANEYDLMDGLEQKDWEAFAEYLGINDPYQHLLSNHNFVHPWDFSNPYTTHCSLQQADAAKIPALFQKYHKPVIYDELGYEGNIPYNWGNLSGFEIVNRFWKTCCMGAYATHGETYMEKMDDNQILWWSKGGTLKGESVRRIAYMRELFEEIPGTLTLYHSPDAVPFETQQQLHKMVENGKLEIANNLVFKCMCKLNDGEFAHMMEFMTPPIVHYKDKVFLTYLGDACTIYTTINLPEDAVYTVEIIDVWEMTRTVVKTNASGKTEIDLPGKVGIAVLATKEALHCG